MRWRFLSLALFACACASSHEDSLDDATQADTSAPVPKTVTWHLDIENPVDVTVNATWFDVDLWDNVSTTLISDLHTRGRKVVCYFSAGSGENWRPDYGSIPRAALGNPLDGWAGEKWLDVRNAGVRTVMSKRMDRAKTAGCDGVDPDNVDGWQNDTGFPLKSADQLDFNRFLAKEAHARGMVVSLKNDVDQIGALVGSFDFAVNEECFANDECEKLAPFIRAGKSVLNVEYGNVTTKKRTVCPKANADGFFTILSAQNRMNGTYTRCRN
jgi:hypothetical protein